MPESSPDSCPRCLMDATAQNFHLENTGFCNYCSQFEREYILFQNDKLSYQETLLGSQKPLIEKIKADGKNKKYDCIVGLSGGVDSSWVLYLAVTNGLRPLAVHMDNGWNSELSQENIQNLIRKLNVDLFTYVIEWEEYRDLQQAFFDADVIDIELLYDNALFKVNHMLADRYGLKYILSGSNFSTEGMQMPVNWAYKNKLDATNITSIWKKKGKAYPLKSFPIYGYKQHLWYIGLKRIKWVRFLDYFIYDKQKALNELIEKLGYRPYLYKHYESVFTRFYQGYILPEKFNVDKRKVHLSTLVMTGQLSRQEAIKKLNDSPYENEMTLKNDIDYFLKKMNWNDNDLKKYLERKAIDHEYYGSENFIWYNILSPAKKMAHNLIKKL